MIIRRIIDEKLKEIHENFLNTRHEIKQKIYDSVTEALCMNKQFNKIILNQLNNSLKQQREQIDEMKKNLLDK